MKLASFFATLPLLTGAIAPPALMTPPKPIARTVCEIKKMAVRQPHVVEVVSVTAIAYYDYEYGYFLTDPECADPADGTGLLRIELPAGSRIEEFPELVKLSSHAWLAGAVGKKPRCTCIGTASFKHGNVTFTLKVAKAVWASD